MLETTNSTYTVNLPKPALPLSQKNDKWKRNYLDAGEMIARTQTNLKHRKYSNIYRIIKGENAIDFDNSGTFSAISKALGTPSNDVLETLEKKSVKSFDEIGGIVEKIIQLYLEITDKVKIDAVDDTSRNEYINTKTDLVYDALRNLQQLQLKRLAISKGLDPDLPEDATDEQKQQMLQQLDEMAKNYELEAIEDNLKKNYRNIAIEFAENTKETDTERYRMKDMAKESMLDFLVSGSWYRTTKMGIDYYKPENWGQMETFIVADEKETDPRKSMIIGRHRFMAPYQVIEEYGHLISAKDAEAIINNTNFNGSTHGIVHDTLEQMLQSTGMSFGIGYDAKQIADRNINLIHQVGSEELAGALYGIKMPSPEFNGASYHVDPTRGDIAKKLEVTEMYFRTYEKVGFIRYVRDGEIVIDQVSEEIEKDFLKENDIKTLRNISVKEFFEDENYINSICWMLKPEIRWGVKINNRNSTMDDHLYIGGDKYEIVRKNHSDFTDFLMPVCGLMNKKSRVKDVANYQVLINIAMSEVQNYTEKQMGKFFLMDYRYISDVFKGTGGEDTLVNFQQLAREYGLVPTDFSTNNVQGTQQQMAPFSVQDLSNFDAIQANLNMAKQYKQEMYSKLGLQLQSEVQPVNSEQNGNEIVNVSTSLTLEYIFQEFIEGEIAYWENHIEVAKFAKCKNIDKTTMYAESDLFKSYLQNTDLDLMNRDIRIYPMNNPEERRKLIEAKQFLLMNTLASTLEERINISSADSLKEIMEISRAFAIKAEKQQQQAAEQQKQLEELRAQNEQKAQELEHTFKMREIQLKGMIDIKRQQLMSLGFSKNPENIDDITKNMKLALDLQSQEYDQMMQERQMMLNEANSQKQEEFAKEKLDLEKEKVRIKEKQVDSQLTQSIVNKNRYDK